MVSIRSNERNFEFAVIRKIALQTQDQLGPLDGAVTIEWMSANAESGSHTFFLSENLSEFLQLVHTHRIDADLTKLIGKVIVVDVDKREYVGPLAGVNGYRRPANIKDGVALPDIDGDA